MASMDGTSGVTPINIYRMVYRDIDNDLNRTHTEWNSDQTSSQWIQEISDARDDWWTLIPSP